MTELIEKGLAIRNQVALFYFAKQIVLPGTHLDVDESVHLAFC